MNHRKVFFLNHVETSQLIGSAGFFFGFFLTETLSQTDISLLAVSLVVFFKHFSQCDMYTMHIGF